MKMSVSTTFLWIFCLGATAVNSQFFDLPNLGASIEKSVKDSLTPLNNLGKNIRVPSFQNIGSHIGQDVDKGINFMHSGLSNLGNEITQHVEQSLLPVKAMALKLQMMNGIGGQTIVKYPDGKVLLAQNGQLFECTGTISDKGKCDGSLSELNLNITKNFCYVQPNVRVNNYMCFSGNGFTSVTEINGQVTCSSGKNNTPVLLITDEDYRKMCGGNGGKATYTYLADVNNPNSVKIPNSNTLLQCQNDQPNVCIFSDN